MRLTGRLPRLLTNICLQRRRRSKMPKRYAMLCALTLLPILSGCVTTTGSAETNAASFCDLAKPIHWSRSGDTPETIIEAKEHNALGVKFCGWKGAVK